MCIFVWPFYLFTVRTHHMKSFEKEISFDNLTNFVFRYPFIGTFLIIFICLFILYNGWYFIKKNDHLLFSYYYQNSLLQKENGLPCAICWHQNFLVRAIHRLQLSVSSVLEILTKQWRFGRGIWRLNRDNPLWTFFRWL